MEVGFEFYRMGRVWGLDPAYLRIENAQTIIETRLHRVHYT